MNLGIVIGVNEYKSDRFDSLAACKQDAEAIHSVLHNVKDFQEIVYLNNDESGEDIKSKISEFVTKYKDKDIKEVVFYFSGHGERFEEDFFYLPSNFDSQKRETTGLRNSELDEWLKILSPNLCVKVVDACFSGTQYIKSQSSTEADLNKSARKYGLNDIYFLFSSREDELSFAGNEFSKFTESILTALLYKSGDVRYREISDFVADDFSSSGKSKPIFITQSNNIEMFGYVNTDTHNIINKAFGLDSDSDEKNSERNNTTKKNQPELSVFDLAAKMSDKACFDELKVCEFIKAFNFEMLSWDGEIIKAYEPTLDDSVTQVSEFIFCAL